MEFILKNRQIIFWFPESVFREKFKPGRKGRKAYETGISNDGIDGKDLSQSIESSEDNCGYGRKQGNQRTAFERGTGVSDNR